MTISSIFLAIFGTPHSCTPREDTLCPAAKTAFSRLSRRSLDP